MKKKVIVVGDSGVGKTSLIYTLVSRSADIKPTIGLEYHKYKSDDLELTIWDTAGQEKYRSISISYFRMADAVIAVFDVTNRASFESLGFWIEKARDIAGDNVPIIVARNKTDLEDEAITDTEFYEWASQNRIEGCDTSCHAKDTVKQLMDFVVQKLRECEVVDEKDVAKVIPQESREKKCC